MYRVGLASDIHVLKENRVLKLGGITVTNKIGPLAHSDGDVLIHAIVEALIGAMGLGDLGVFFPDSDSQYKDIDSTYFLNEIKRILKVNKYQIVNIDSQIQLEDIRLESYKKTIAQNIAKILEIEENKVNVKAGTNEKLDAVGSGKAIYASAIVMIKKEELEDE